MNGRRVKWVGIGLSSQFSLPIGPPISSIEARLLLKYFGQVQLRSNRSSEWLKLAACCYVCHLTLRDNSSNNRYYCYCYCYYYDHNNKKVHRAFRPKQGPSLSLSLSLCARFHYNDQPTGTGTALYRVERILHNGGETTTSYLSDSTSLRHTTRVVV